MTPPTPLAAARACHRAALHLPVDCAASDDAYPPPRPHPNTTLPQTVAQYRTALHHPLHGATPPHGPPPRLGPVLPATPNPTMPCTHTAPLPPASTYLALLPPSSRCLRVCTASVGRGYSLEQSGYSPDHPSPPPLTQGHATAAPPRSHSRVALRSMTGETPAFREPPPLHGVGKPVLPASLSPTL